MISKTKSSLIALNTLSAILSVAIVAGGAISLSIKVFSEANRDERIVSDFNSRLSSRVGGIYTSEMHQELSHYIASLTQAKTSSINYIDKIGEVATMLGIATLASSAASLLLLFREGVRTAQGNIANMPSNPSTEGVDGKPPQATKPPS